MATTVLSAMQQFLSAIQPTTNQVREASTSHTALRDYLRGELAIVEDFLTGSYKRNTMIRQSRDVDLFLVLHDDYWNGYWSSGNWYDRKWIPGYKDQVSGPANLLDRVRRLLKARYPRSDISRDGQAVAVQFDHIHIDVVPAFTSGIGYIIPNTSGNNWLQSNPKQHVAEVSETNARSDVSGRLVPVAKMIKHWNYAHDYGMRGFFLEMWMRDIFSYAALPDHAHGLYSFFNSAINWLDKGLTVPDPSTGTDLMQVFLKTNSQRTTARSRFVLGLNLAVQAIDANDAGDNATAIANWKRLFGPAFPAYG
jgi:hypothetical protein